MLHSRQCAVTSLKLSLCSSVPPQAHNKCLTHWHIWLCHTEVGRTLVLSPSTYNNKHFLVTSVPPRCRYDSLMCRANGNLSVADHAVNDETNNSCLPAETTGTSRLSPSTSKCLIQSHLVLGSADHMQTKRAYPSLGLPAGNSPPCSLFTHH
jgi:hypothetical protein